MRRRKLLALAGSGLVAPLAGCATGSDDDQSDTSSESTPEDGTDGSESGSESVESEDGEAADEETDGGDTQEQESGGETGSEWPSGSYADYDSTTVTVTDEDGGRLGEVTAALAESSEEWSLGLSDAESMPEDGGMLFVSQDANYESFYMRDMDFGLDIIFVGEDRSINVIHHVPAPAAGDDGTEDQYTVSGFGQHVFEVNAGWTAERGITEGDVLEFDL